MAAVTICSDFGAPKNKVYHGSIVSPSVCHEVMGPDGLILVFWMLGFRPTFLLSSFTFIKRLFISSLLSALRVVSSAYVRLLLFLPAILIPACASSSPAFYMMYSTYKLNKQGDNIQPWHTSFPIWNQSVVPCLVLINWTLNCGKFLKRWKYQTTWPASWEICMQVKKQQLELYKAVYCHQNWERHMYPIVHCSFSLNGMLGAGYLGDWCLQDAGRVSWALREGLAGTGVSASVWSSCMGESGREAPLPGHLCFSRAAMSPITWQPLPPNKGPKGRQRKRPAPYQEKSTSRLYIVTLLI